LRGKSGWEAVIFSYHQIPSCTELPQEFQHSFWKLHDLLKPKIGVQLWILDTHPSEKSFFDKDFIHVTKPGKRGLKTNTGFHPRDKTWEILQNHHQIENEHNPNDSISYYFFLSLS